MIIVWMGPETIAPINPRAGAWATCMTSWTCLGVVTFAGLWLARRALSRRRIVGCLVSSETLTLLTPQDPIELPLASVVECRAIDHYDFVVEAEAEARADPAPRKWFASVSLMYTFKHPKHKQGVAIWRHIPLKMARGNPLILLVMSDGRRFVFDVDCAPEVIGVINKRRASRPTGPDIIASR